METDALLGSWELEAFHATDADGRVSHPYGPDPIGLLVYTNDGRVTFQFGRRQRSLLPNPSWRDNSDADLADAARGCHAYFGTYELHEHEVVHHVEFSLVPNWTGETLRRTVELSGDRLVLTAPGSVISGREQTVNLVWRRPKARERAP